MEKKKSHDNNSGMSSTGGKVVTGVGIAAIAAAAAGALFFYGTEAGKKKRNEIKAWKLRMQADVLERMEKMKDWSEISYQSIVDTAVEKYKNLKNIDPAELKVIADDLKKHWKNIKRQVEGTQAKPKRKAAPKKKLAPPTSKSSSETSESK